MSDPVAAGTAAVAATSSGGTLWPTIITMIGTVIAAIFTGTGSVSDEQAAMLNSVSPGLGTAFQAAVGASNGLAESYLTWRARSETWNFIAGEGGIVQTVWGFIRENPLLAIGGAWLVFRMLKGPAIKTFISRKEEPAYGEDIY